MDNIKKDENFQNTFIDIFNNQNYLKELTGSKLMNQINSDMNSSEEQIFEKIKDIFIQEYNLEIKGEINEDKKPLENMIAINVNEKIINIKNKKNYNNNVINSFLVDKIFEKKNIKEIKNKFFLTSFKLEEMEYIWKGDYNDRNKKNGKGEEYDLDDNIVFEGEYENGIRTKGIEYYIIGTKKYEGYYKDGKRWDGIIYDIQ